MDTSLFQPFYDSSGICTDTRAIAKDSLFICIKGANFDGNTFAQDALNAGAKHVILDDPTYYSDQEHMTLVDDSVLYLQKLANFHRRKFDIPIIGITGSNGKTTSKELIHAVLSKKYNVLATQGNLNNHLGVPFTLLNLNEGHEIAIIEMGANKFKDIEELSDIAEPNYGIITNIGKAHLEGFINFEGVLTTKKELFDAIEKNQGSIIINSDDPVLTGILPKTVDAVTFGTNESADITGELKNLSPFVEMTWKTNQYTSPILKTQMVGKYNFYNYLAAAAFGHLFNVEPSLISEAIEEYAPTNNRSQIKKTQENTLILDCYNANPSSMRLALESFALNPQEKKLAILGSMKELGAESSEQHQDIIGQLEKSGISAFLVGEEFENLTSNAVKQWFETTADLQKHLLNSPITDHLILLKGSRSIGLEVLEKNL